MSTFKKKQIEESVGGDIFNNGGDRNVTSNSEIETGPIEKPFNDHSDYEKGQATTTDRVFGRYRQNIPWFAVYTFGSSRVGSVASDSQLRENNSTVIKKKNIEDIIEDLVKKNNTSEIIPKDYNNKLAKVLDAIKDIDLSDENIKKITKALNDKKPVKDKKTL